MRLLRQFLPLAVSAIVIVVPLKGLTDENSEADIYLLPSVAYHFLDDKGNIDDLSSVGLNVGYQLDRKWAIEFGARVGTSESRFGDDADMLSWQMDGLYQLNKRGAWQPYIVGSLMDLSFDVDKTRHETLTGLGVGSYYRLTEHLQLRGDARVNYSHTFNLFDSALTLGLQFAFGGEPKQQSTKPVVEISPVLAAPILPHLYTFEVHFGTGKATLLPEYRAHVADLVSVLKNNPNSRIVIEGDSDSTGSEALNLRLSEKRAASVKTMLVEEHAIHADRIGIKALGESQPIADNRTSEGRAKNRRAVVKVRIIHQ